MSVLACDRRGCRNVMCDRLIKPGDTEYYVCNDCWVELVARKDAEWPRELSRSALIMRIDEFFRTAVVPWPDPVLRDAAVDDEFDQLTANRQRD